MNVMEQHNSLTSDYDYVEKPLSEYSSNETMHMQSMNPEPANDATSYSYNQDILPANLFYNSSGINHPYETINQNSADFNPIYYENPPKDVESIHPFSVQSPMVDPSSIVPSTMNYIDSNTTPVVEYNNVSSLPTDMEHLPSSTMSDYAVIGEMQEPRVNVESDTPLEQLHIASALLDVPLEQLNNDAVSVPQKLSEESIDLNKVSQEVPMISTDTSVHFNHEPLDTLGSCSNIPSNLEPIVNSSEYHDDSSQSMVIDENPQLSINYEVEEQTVPQNVDTSNRTYSESESLSTCETNEITIGSQTSNTNEVISTVEDENTSRSNEEKEQSLRTEAEEENCEVTNQVNGTLHEAENDIPVVQMCIRNGCANPAVNNPEWEQEFCSNDCVVMHCRNVFDAWVEANAVMSQ